MCSRKTSPSLRSDNHIRHYSTTGGVPVLIWTCCSFGIQQDSFDVTVSPPCQLVGTGRRVYHSAFDQFSIQPLDLTDLESPKRPQQCSNPFLSVRSLPVRRSQEGYSGSAISCSSTLNGFFRQTNGILPLPSSILTFFQRKTISTS